MKKLIKDFKPFLHIKEHIGNKVKFKELRTLLRKHSMSENDFIFLRKNINNKHKLANYFLCPTCGKLKPYFHRIQYCSPKCAANNENTKNKRIKTVKKKYGVSHIMKLEINKELIRKSKTEEVKKRALIKSKRTMLKHYGVDNPSKSDIIKKKKIETCRKNNGVDYYSQTKKAKKSLSNRCLSNTEEFISKARKVHGNKYDYSKVKYKGSQTNVKIICPIHGEFMQRPNNHLSGRGCSYCNKKYSSIEKECLQTLEKAARIKLSITKNNLGIHIPETNYYVDGYNKRLKLIVEFNGDIWHGNPKLYKSTDINPVTKCTYGSLLKATKRKERILKNKGYKVFSIWQNDWQNNKKEVINNFVNFF